MERDIGELKGYVAMLLTDIIKDKESRQVNPMTADMNEIQNMLIADAKSVLNELCRERALTFHKTLNGISFEFTPANQ